MTGGRPLEILDWGLMDYSEALDRQKVLVQERIDGRAPDRLVLVEHPPVVTIGRSGSAADLCVSEADLMGGGYTLHHVERGGQATVHLPGQMVAYPIVKLRRPDLHGFLETLLDCVATVLKSYGLVPERVPDRPGIYINHAKIASVGLAVRHWVTYHGLSLNVNPDLSGFGLIVPCGVPGQAMTSLARETDRPVAASDVRQRFVAAFANGFRYDPMNKSMDEPSPRPEWLVRPAPDTGAIERMETMLGDLELSTVCREAHCPNLGECFGRGTATVMILGDVCTRNCRFCAVKTGRPASVDQEEPWRVARAAARMGLRHVVVTSVTRDDLPDGGASQFAAVIREIKRLNPEASVEVLIPDFKGMVRALDLVIDQGPDVINHNLETVPRLYGRIRPGAVYRGSLDLLSYVASRGQIAKSGLMLGLGETDDEIAAALGDLKRAGCSLLTLGQYLAPSSAHAPMIRYVSPDEFRQWEIFGRELGFHHVSAGPLVRSSYRAENMVRIISDRSKGEGYGLEALHS